MPVLGQRQLMHHCQVVMQSFEVGRHHFLGSESVEWGMGWVGGGWDCLIQSSVLGCKVKEICLQVKSEPPVLPLLYQIKARILESIASIQELVKFSKQFNIFLHHISWKINEKYYIQNIIESFCQARRFIPNSVRKTRWYPKCNVKIWDYYNFSDCKLFFWEVLMPISTAICKELKEYCLENQKPAIR